jgi:NADPH-dependent glutamate synthase beta subunit-like oxidoreductase
MPNVRRDSRDPAAAARSADVCVIGGGPAGSTIAHRLASLGHEVCLVERDAAPRPHIAASLPATILPLLEVIGVRERVEGEGFLLVVGLAPVDQVAPRAAQLPCGSSRV